MAKRTVEERVSTLLRRRRNKWMGCRSQVVKAYMAREERSNLKMLFEKFGVKYWLEKKRIRVAYKIPWGVEFDVRNPSACPKAGTWNGMLECFIEVWNSTPPKERAEFLHVPYDEKNPVLNSNLTVKKEV